MRTRSVKLMTLAVSAVTAVSLSACVAPGLNPTTKPKPPTTTKPPALLTTLTGTVAGKTYAVSTIKTGIYRVRNAWVTIHNAAGATLYGASATNPGTALATIDPAHGDRTVKVGLNADGGRLTLISPSNPAHAVPPPFGASTSGAYLVGLDIAPGDYTVSGTNAKVEIFEDYSALRACSLETPGAPEPNQALVDVCHDDTKPGSPPIDMTFDGSLSFTLLPGDYILRYTGALSAA